jgi:hypothetical protein
MSLGGPSIYPGVLSWLGIARELTAGTPLVPVVTHPLEQAQFEPEDMPRFLKDNAIRGSMTDLFYETLGVESGQFSLGGPNFLDTHGYFFDNMFGDLSTTGSNLGTPATANGALAVGATACTLSAAPPASYTAGATIQIDTGSISEVFVIASTTASSVVNFGIAASGESYPLRFAHATGVTLQTCSVSGPFTHKFAALNSPLGYGGAYGAQPPTHTLTDVTNIVNTFTSPTYGTVLTNTYGARQYAFAALKTLDMSGNAEQLLGIRMTGDSFLSNISGTAVTNVTTNSRPIPNWDTTLVVAGNTISSSNTYNGVGNFSVGLKRTNQVYWTVQGVQSPYVIARGPLNADGTLDFDPTNSEMPLDLMLLNSQPPVSIKVSNAGIANAGTSFTLTITMSQCAQVKSKIMRSKPLIGYSNSWEAVANSTDVGGSGGLGPTTITLVNSTAVYALVPDFDMYQSARHLSEI